MPLLSAADWLKFVVGRSIVDQVNMTQTMARVLLRARWADACCQKMFRGWELSVLGRRSTERRLEEMTAACDAERRSGLEEMTAACEAARRSGLRDKEALAESRNQSSELQEEMCSDVEAISLSLQEAKEQVANLKARLANTKEAATASKMRSGRQVAQLMGEKDALVVEVKELRVERAELNDALGLSHVEEARLGALGVELQGQVAALTHERDQNMVSWARERRDRDVIIGALELQYASKTTESRSRLS